MNNKAVASKSETITENIFRNAYGVNAFIEKSAIPKDKYKFTSKKNTGNSGYPDFLREEGDEYVIIVECKSTAKDHKQAEDETKHYIGDISKKYNSVGIAVSGQGGSDFRVTYFITPTGSKTLEISGINQLLSLEEIQKIYFEKSLQINYDKLISYADKINTKFQDDFKIAVKKRPFFFAALLFSFDRLTTFISKYKVEKFQFFNEKSKRNEVIDFKDPSLSDADKVDYINNIISDGVASKFVNKLNNKFKTINIPAKFQFITSDNKYISSKKYIEFLEDFVDAFK